MSGNGIFEKIKTGQITLSQLNLNTKDFCFLCLRDDKRPVGPFAGMSQICKHLQINLGQIVSDVMKTPAVIAEQVGLCSVESTEVKVTLCESCRKIIQEFCKLRETFELIKLDMKLYLNRIHSTIGDIERNPQLISRYEEKMTRDIQSILMAGFIEELRKQIYTKSSPHTPNEPADLVQSNNNPPESMEFSSSSSSSSEEEEVFTFELHSSTNVDHQQQEDFNQIISNPSSSKVVENYSRPSSTSPPPPPYIPIRTPSLNSNNNNSNSNSDESSDTIVFEMCPRISSSSKEINPPQNENPTTTTASSSTTSQAQYGSSSSSSSSSEDYPPPLLTPSFPIIVDDKESTTTTQEVVEQQQPSSTPRRKLFKCTHCDIKFSKLAHLGIHKDKFHHHHPRSTMADREEGDDDKQGECSNISSRRFAPPPPPPPLLLSPQSNAINNKKDERNKNTNYLFSPPYKKYVYEKMRKKYKCLHCKKEYISMKRADNHYDAKHRGSSSSNIPSDEMKKKSGSSSRGKKRKVHSDAVASLSSSAIMSNGRGPESCEIVSESVVASSTSYHPHPHDNNNNKQQNNKRKGRGRPPTSKSERRRTRKKSKSNNNNKNSKIATTIDAAAAAAARITKMEIVEDRRNITMIDEDELNSGDPFAVAITSNGQVLSEEPLEQIPWCRCQRIYMGEDMVMCEFSGCPFKWYHPECVGVKWRDLPEGKFYCNVKHCVRLRREAKRGKFIRISTNNYVQ